MEQTTTEVQPTSKKYILIQNEGEIESNSFELIGASTKRNSTGKIGFFGSGLKYSIAYMMRKGIDFKVFAGEKELLFTTKKEILKDQEFERICINGTPTSYTTTMGPTWKEDWFVLREIYCNALDEESCTLVKETENVSPSQGKTRIYIEITEALTKVCKDWDAYFSDERTPLFTSPKLYTCYLGHEDGCGENAITVYPKTDGVLYRRGVRVNTNDKYMYDYGCNHVNINEDRTAKNAQGLHYGIHGMVKAMVNDGYVRSILRTASDDKKSEEYFAINTGESSHAWSLEWVKFSEDNLLVIKENAGKYADEISWSKKEVFLIPSSFARDLKKSLPNAVVLGMSNIIGNAAYQQVETTPKMNFLLKEVLASLSEMNYAVKYDISVVDFDQEEVLGMADPKNKMILLASKTFDMGRREIAMTIMEENEHLKSGHGDETRSFQTHIFSQWLKTMEDSNGLFL